MTLKEGLVIAEAARARLAPFCERLSIAGSIRRNREFVGDVDLVVLPRRGRERDLYADLDAMGRVAKRGPQYAVINLPCGEQLDVWFARGREQGLFASVPGNWGALLLTRTGSTEHNIELVRRAKELGLRYHPHAGVVDASGAVVASESEEEIFEALGMDFVPPEERERAWGAGVLRDTRDTRDARDEGGAK